MKLINVCLTSPTDAKVDTKDQTATSVKYILDVCTEHAVKSGNVSAKKVGVDCSATTI